MLLDWAAVAPARGDVERAAELDRRGVGAGGPDRPGPTVQPGAARPGRGARPWHAPDGLSAREAEVLRCVAEGLSNREIGGRLYISQNTVANHVRAILRKTGCANRTEATTYAHRTGIVTTG